MTYEFKVGDRVKTRDGRDARIICVDAPGAHTIVALIHYSTHHFTRDGGLYVGGPRLELDLMPPDPRTRKVKLYAYFYDKEGHTNLVWFKNIIPEPNWQHIYRVPSEDKEIEIEVSE